MDTGDSFVFVVGDRVQLGDGGTPMHVAALSPNMAYCTWVDEDGELRQGTFNKRRLVLLSSLASPPPGADT